MGAAGVAPVSDLHRCRVLVTPTSWARSDPRLRTELEQAVGEVTYNPTGRPLGSADLARLLPGVDGYIAGVDVVDRQALAAADRLRVIARYGVGVDGVDLAAARERGIVVTNTPGANAVSVAELTIVMILALARQLTDAVAATRRGAWPRLAGTALAGKTVGLLGLGAVGRQVARRLSGFDCRVMAHDPAVTSAVADAIGAELAPMDEVVAAADFLSLHLPLTPQTRTVVDATFLARMKPGAYLVNTSRGELVDEVALAEAIRGGRLRGAAVDVFTTEPPPADHPLLGLPQVLATPHCGAHTDDATNAMGWMALRDCLAVLGGRQPDHRVV
jgi:D-3-phosphoglycerate dehydrogenase